MPHSLAIYSPQSYGHTEPSAIRKYYNSLMSSVSGGSYTFDEREGVVHSVVESGATGAALGAAHATLKNGLDVSVAGFHTPIDAIAGVIGLLAASKMHGKVGRTVHAIADRAVAVYAFRSTVKLMSAKSGVHGEIAGDPLVEAAKDL